MVGTHIGATVIPVIHIADGTIAVITGIQVTVIANQVNHHNQADQQTMGTAIVVGSM